MLVWAIIHLSANLLGVIFLSYLCLVNPILGRVFYLKWQPPKAERAFLFAFAGIHIATTAAPCLLAGYLWGLVTAGFVSACLLAHWSLCAYFNCQRYEPDVLRQPGIVRSAPAFLPACLVLSSLGYVAGAVLYVDWYWAFGVLAGWVLYGILFAEVGIRRLERDGLGRTQAMLRLRFPQGPSAAWFFGQQRRKYPFP